MHDVQTYAESAELSSARRMSAAHGVRTGEFDIPLGILSDFGIEVVSEGKVCTPDV